MSAIQFPLFSSRVDEGDSVSVTIDGITLTATVYRDDCTDKPDERQDGFWPSLDPNDAGYIGDKTKAELAVETAFAEKVMRKFKAGDMFYVGVAVTASKAGFTLTGRYEHALWGVECNYPSREANGRADNSYLTECIQDEAGACLEMAKAKIAEIAA